MYCSLTKPDPLLSSLVECSIWWILRSSLLVSHHSFFPESNVLSSLHFQPLSLRYVPLDDAGHNAHLLPCWLATTSLQCLPKLPSLSLASHWSSPAESPLPVQQRSCQAWGSMCVRISVCSKLLDCCILFFKSPASESPSKMAAKKLHSQPQFYHRCASVACILYLAWQCFMPYSHFLTKVRVACVLG